MQSFSEVGEVWAHCSFVNCMKEVRSGTRLVSASKNNYALTARKVKSEVLAKLTVAGSKVRWSEH